MFRISDCPDMVLAVDHGCKTSIHKNNSFFKVFNTCIYIKNSQIKVSWILGKENLPAV